MNNESDNFNAVERALYYAVRFMARMDECAGAGNATDVPEVIAWAIEQVRPELLTPLRDSGSYEQFLELLGHLRPLRAAAERFRGYSFGDLAVPGEDEGHLTLGYLCHQLGRRQWRRYNAPGKRSIERVIRAATLRDAAQKYRPFPHRDLGDEDSRSGPPRVPPSADAHSLALPDPLDAELPMGTDSAFQHAKTQLLACDDGAPRFWENVYTCAAGDWLTHDMPESAARILGDGLLETYSATLRGFESQMYGVERYWTLLSYPVRLLLLRSGDEALVVRIIRSLIEGSDRPPEKNLDAWAVRVWEMTKRRAVRPSNSLAEPIVSYETNALIQTLRADDMKETRCFVVDASSLPPLFSSIVSERFALVVCAQESWLDAGDELKLQMDLMLEVYEAARAEDNRLLLRVSKALYVEKCSLWPHLSRFRRVIPVVYVFHDQIALVGYDFGHFPDLHYLSSLPRRWVQWIKAEEFAKEQPRTTLATMVRDLTSTPSLTALGQAIIKPEWGCQRPV
ncbi:hypothetical protein [Paraburkholderia caledonica]|uniref:Uncharacterized protein n=1 Tax=Paraburkholderia caledonica TaxID=134536 RepID=A0ABU1KYN5_9BURK|nr:hypothetical protein [Paraburkholderia caledonica]MDR6376083.1 hypothetical protein [Paraburkholderia caledonica]